MSRRRSGSLQWAEFFKCRYEGGVAIDHSLGAQIPGGNVRVAKRDSYDGDLRGLRGCDVRRAVADHDGSSFIARGQPYRSTQVVGMGLADGECVTTSDGEKSIFQTERLEQAYRQRFALVGANRQLGAALAKCIERVDNSRVGAAAVGDIGLLVR
mgnify:CR=1 FL=1